MFCHLTIESKSESKVNLKRNLLPIFVFALNFAFFLLKMLLLRYFLIPSIRQGEIIKNVFLFFDKNVQIEKSTRISFSYSRLPSLLVLSPLFHLTQSLSPS